MRVLIYILILGGLLPCGAATQGSNANPRTVRFREPHSSSYVLIEPSDTSANGKARPVWTRGRPAGSATNLVEFGSRVVLQLAPGTALNTVLTNQNLTLSRTVRSNLFILQATDSQSAIDAAETLAAQEGVWSSYPVMRRSLRPHNAYAAAPNDPRFGEQWHLENRGADGNLAGLDLNARAAWPLAQGQGVRVAVVDTGFQLDHPELTNRAVAGPHYNFFLGTSAGGPYASDADHATAVAGLIAAEAQNSRGVAGVAPQAALSSWVIFGTSFGQESIASDEQLMDMFEYAGDRVAVQNHSWGNAGTAPQALDALSDSGIENAVTTGRGGKGVIIVRAAGNYRADLINANDDGYANDPRAIAVAAVRKDGRACSYSNPGACVLVGAPSGDVIDTDADGAADAVDPAAPDVLTTDRTGVLGYVSGSGDAADYTGFDGTSASCPQVAGVAALLLSVNTNLTYRDVQQLLIQSARHYDFKDPDVRTNGAGFGFSHNLGFGVPDTGWAADLARTWSNRPARTRMTISSSTITAIPDDALRVVCSANGLGSTLTNLHCLPSLGRHPDDATAALPLVYVGQANEELTVDLKGKAALIQRGTSYFVDKINRAARAGAAAVIVFNNTGTTAIQAMGGTDYASIPAVSISKTDGEALRNFITTNSALTAKLQLTPATRQFTVSPTLLCEHVGVRLKTTHTERGDVRVALVSPMGSRSVLQAINDDSSSGPADWTYWSVQHFYECSAGTWRLEVSDERNTTIQSSPFSSIPATGSVTYAELIITGVVITDTDHDGLADDWEQKYFGNLGYGATDDPDQDGFSNAREQVMGTDPSRANATFTLDFAEWKSGYWRLSWPAREGGMYFVAAQDDSAQPWLTLSNRTGILPVTDFVVGSTNRQRFFRVHHQ